MFGAAFLLLIRAILILLSHQKTEVFLYFINLFAEDKSVDRLVELDCFRYIGPGLVV